jgi:cytosine/adenosine deaminase-related metal-dependent hydrolase
MPAPPSIPSNFISVLEQIWWRLDAALDLDTIYWSAALGAAEAVLSGTTAIIDHHESPFAIEGSLDAIRQGCELVGVRTNLSYGVTDRWHNGHLRSHVDPHSPMTDEARRGLEECRRYIKADNKAMVGVHASFTCSQETLEAAAELANDLGTGVHIHVAEGSDDANAGARLQNLTADNWLLVHCVHLDTELSGTVVHNPRSNMNNAVGYARPTSRTNRVVLGTDGIGADMIDEARVAYVRLREHDVRQNPEIVWSWLKNSYEIFPEALHDRVTWNADVMNPWVSAFTTGVHVNDVVIDGRQVVANGSAVSFDYQEIRAKASEAAKRLHARL